MGAEKARAADFSQGGRRTGPAAQGAAATVAGGPAPGRAQVAAAPDIDADVEAIRALCAQVTRIWDGLAASTREDLVERVELLSLAAVARDTDTRIVRATLQEVLLIIGIGALATLNEATGRRLAALTGIALPRYGES